MLSNCNRRVLLAVAAMGLPLAGCSIAPAAGPSSRVINGASDQPVANAGIKIIDVSDTVARQVIAAGRSAQFAESLGDGQPVGSIVGKGDVLDIAVWEAPPAALFGAAGGDARLTSSSSTARGTSIPEQMVDSDGRITIPFVGRVQAAGRTPQEIARFITQALIGKAHQPQVVVRVSRNLSTNVAVVGDVGASGRLPLTAKGERLLDIIAEAGGVKQPVNKMTIQVTRGGKVVAMPLETVIKDPHQNIRLQPDDVVTALFQPFSFVALGATGRNEEVNFEGSGISLAQALGRVSGIQDQRADVKGVFLFRLEDPIAVDAATRATARTTPDGKIPVIYRINLKDPATFFVAQGFPIRNKDVLYVTNAPLADIQKFVNVISSTILPVATATTIVQ